MFLLKAYSLVLIILFVATDIYGVLIWQDGNLVTLYVVNISFKMFRETYMYSRNALNYI